MRCSRMFVRHSIFEDGKKNGSLHIFTDELKNWCRFSIVCSLESISVLVLVLNALLNQSMQNPCSVCLDEQTIPKSDVRTSKQR